MPIKKKKEKKEKRSSNRIEEETLWICNRAKRTTRHKSEGVQEDDTDLDGTQVSGQALSTNVPGSHKTWGSQLKRYPW
ncbi:hypothetical protein Taro_028035 [Colocasia esculenta]|uniref:Uncharacterized protein n=1 Tax=Colocasia esculenta TaxID=4460 RepID=A0A843VP87_COLES|nr:hypothetical protein [Colocasia esculenta]